MRTKTQIEERIHILQAEIFHNEPAEFNDRDEEQYFIGLASELNALEWSLGETSCNPCNGIGYTWNKQTDNRESCCLCHGTGNYSKRTA